MKLILASSSPRRTELMSKAGLIHEVCKPDAQAEDSSAAQWADQEPHEFAVRLATLKALAVARQQARQQCVVIGADTIASYKGKILGKPKDRGEAKAMIRELSADSHDVITGLALIFLDSGLLVTEAVTTEVILGPDDGFLVSDYVEAGLADGKAGAYGIQDPLIAPLIRTVNGPFDNVIGLPLTTLQSLLARHGALK